MFRNGGPTEIFQQVFQFTASDKYIQRHLPPETWCAIFRPAESTIVNNNTINIWQKEEIKRWAFLRLRTHGISNLYDVLNSVEYLKIFFHALFSTVAMNINFKKDTEIP